MVRLLLVDDDPVLLLDQITHVFPPPSFQVDVARTGAEGLARVAAQMPDAILLAVRLPDLSGLELYQRIRKIDARIPVVFIPATTTTETAIEAMKQGAYDYLFKPVDLAQ